jgi:hypothetical protein
VLASGNRRTWTARSYSGPVRIFRINPSKGWHDLVHVLSHWCDYVVNGSGSHDAHHARLELKMIKQVIRRGWLEGKLKREKQWVDPRVIKGNAALDKLERQRALLKKWETKKKRAETAIRKLTRQIKAAERRRVA